MGSRAASRPIVIASALARLAADALPGRRRAPPAAPRRILVAHHLLLGDTLMLTPLLAKCRARWPDADIVLTCPVAYAGLYAGRPYGVRALPYDPRDAATLRPLRATAGFDLALVPGDNRLSWLARALDARWIVAFAGDSPAWKDWPVDELRTYPDAPMAWGDLVAGLVDGPAPAPYRPGDWPPPPARTFGLPPVPYVVLHVGASSPLKQWAPSRWRQLGRRLAATGFSVALSAGPGEAELLDAIDPSGKWMRYAGTLSLPELWHLLARAELVVCPDTGIAHLTRLIGVPTVALFGPGSALLSGAGEFWRKSPFTALTIPDFPCRDQAITMKREVAWIRRCERFPGTAPGQCPEARCMAALTEEMVWAAVAARLGIAPG
jgi:ADP-heptose:LPS heptosyltransferase